MESKLKALKVADLKDILTKANVTLGKANKQDLINKILASDAAINVYKDTYGPAPGHASAAPSSTPEKSKAPPPPKLAHSPSSSQPAKTAPAPTSPSKATSKATPATTPAAASDTKPSEEPSTDAAPASALDEEAEKRKARAARFGIPFVEPQPKRSPGKKNVKGVVNGKATKDDPEKLATRAARFGTQTPTEQETKGSSKKRLAPAEPVDEEELARRKKRAERFGIPAVGV